MAYLNSRTSPQPTGDLRPYVQAGRLQRKLSPPPGELCRKKEKKYNQEQLRKRIKKAEGMQREWDEIKQSERDKKKVILEERVKIQRQLILKTDMLSKQLWNAAEQKKLKEVEERRRVRLEVARTLRDHISKIEEHKRRIAEKLREMGSESNVTSEHNVTPNTRLNPGGNEQSNGNHDNRDTHTPDHSEKPYEDAEDLLEGNGPKASITIEEVWDGLRAKSVKKLHTIATHSNMLKKSISSPSARLCLEIYERPTTHSSATGRPVPFSELIGGSSGGDVREKPAGVQTNVLAASIRLKEKKAQYMMSRKEHPTAPQGTGTPEWYGLAPPPPVPPTRHSVSHTDQLVCVNRLTNHTSDMVDDHTCHAGEMEAGGEVDDGPTCSQVTSQLGDAQTGDMTHKGSHVGYKGPSVFITDIMEPSVVGKMQRPSKWQPLSHRALVEYSTVCELPIRGLGDQVHGKYKMWRPY
eukprot:Em0001g2521a